MEFINFKNKTLFFSLIVIIFISISCVSASENDTLLTSNARENVICIGGENDNLTADVGTYAELERAFLSNDKFVFEKDYAAHSGEGIINISRSIEIDGKGHTIDGGQFTGIFQSYTSQSNGINVVIKNLILKNAKSQCGGAIRVDYALNVHYIIDNCTFINNQAYSSVSSSASGAIYFGSIGGFLDINNSIFKNCSSFHKYTYHNDGGAIFLGGESHGFQNSIFENNKAEMGDGGVICIDNDDGLELVNCRFNSNMIEGNDHAYRGGAICNRGKGNLRIIKSNFTGNKISVTKTDLYSEGGAVYSENRLELDGCIFRDNTAFDNGGAVCADKLLWLENPSIFINNHVENSNVIRANKGGAVYASTFENTAKDLIFINNRGYYGGAVYINNKNDITFESCYFEGNIAKNTGSHGCGAAIYVDSSRSKLNLINNIFSNNEASTDYAVYNCGIYGTVNNNWWGINDVNFDDSYLIEWHRTGSNDKIKDSNSLRIELTSNKYEVYKAPVKLTLKFVCSDKTPFNGELTNWDVTFTSDKNGTFTNKEIRGNKATVTYMPKSASDVVTAQVNNQKVSITIKKIGDFTWLQQEIDAANGVYKLNHDLSYSVGIDNIVDGILIDKKIIINGNGHTLNALGISRIFNVQSSNVVINNFTFINGREIINGGGAIFINNIKNVTVSNSIFKNNYAREYGGAIYVHGGKNIRILNSEFTNNHADAFYCGGGAVFLSAPNSVIENSKFTSNDAVQGGALDLRGDSITVDGCEFRNNYILHTIEGGSAINSFGNELIVLKSIFLNNKGEAKSLYYINKENKLIFTMTGYNNYINAISSSSSVKFFNVTYWDGNVTIGSNPPRTENESGMNFTLEIFDSDNKIVKKVLLTSDSSGHAVYDYSNLALGNYTFKASHFDDEYYTFVDVNGEFEVTRPVSYPSSVKINMLNKTEFDYNNCTITFDVINRTGDVGVLIANEDFSKAFYDNDTDLNYVVVNLPASDKYYNIIVFNYGNETYDFSSDVKSFKLNKIDSNVIVNNIKDVYYGDTVKVTYKGDGEIYYLTVYDKNNKSVFSQITNKQTVNIPVLPVGLYTVTVINLGNENKSQSKDSKTFNVLKKDNNFHVSVGDVTYGSDVSILVNADVDGKYVVDVNSTKITVDVLNGVGNASLTLDAGKYYANISFNNDNYNNKATNDEFNVMKAQSHVKFYIGNVTFNQTEVVYINDDFPTKYNVTLYDQGNNIIFNTITDKNNITLPALNVGQYNLTVVNIGNKNIIGSKYSEIFDVTLDNYVEIYIEDSVYGRELLIFILADVDGFYAVDINGTELIIEVVDGFGYDDALQLPAGDYYANVSYDNPDYNNIIENTSFTIYRAESNVKIYDIDNVTYGEDVHLEYYDDYNATFTVVVFDENDEAVWEFRTNATKVIISDLAAGNYTLMVTNEGDENIIGMSEFKNFTVYKATPKMKVTSEGNEINVELPEDATGNVSTVINGREEFYPVVDGIAIIPLYHLKPGNYSFNVKYSGDKNYTGTSGKISVEISKITPEMTVKANQKEISVVLPDDATGKVKTTVNGKEITAAVSKGKSVIPLSDLNPGNYTFDVRYLGNDKYYPRSEKASLNIPKIDPKMNASFEINEIIVELPEDATGNVTTTINGIYHSSPVVDGLAIIPMYDVKPGNYTLNIKYSGDDKYLEDNAKVDAEIYKITPEMTVFAKDNVINVVLPDDATGNVTVNVGGKDFSANVVNGKATITVTGLEPGKYSANVKYSGDDKYYPRSEKTSVIIPKIDPNMNASFEINEIVVELPQDATGNVTTTINGIYHSSPVVDGLAIIPMYDVKPGNYTLDIKYSGDDKYLEDNEKVDAVLDKVTPEMTVSTKDNVINLILPDDASGNVTVNVGGKDFTAQVKNGKATITVTGLEPGKYSANVKYSGNDYYYPRTEKADVTIPKIAPEMKVHKNNDNIIVELPDDATGNVVLEVAGEKLTAPVENGKAEFSLDKIPSGEHDAKITYSGDDKYKSAKASEKISIDGIELVADDVVKYFSGSERLVVTLLNNDKPVKSKEINITLNGVIYSRITDDKGQASLGINLVSGNYTALVETEEYSISTLVDIEVKSTIYSNDLVKVFRNATQFNALFLDSKGNPLANTDVIFNIHGVFYTRTTNATGWAKLNINLEEGKYIITAINTKTSESKGYNITVLSLIESNDLIKYYKNDSQFVVRVHSDAGGWAKEGEEVLFNINGIFYVRITNETGHVKLNINLNPGEYIITADCKGCYKSNSILVLPTLTAEDLNMKYKDGSKFTAKVVDGQGKPYPNQNVTFNVNGVFYTRTTDANGEAKLNINLMAGEYIITSGYNGAYISNKITISS